MVEQVQRKFPRSVAFTNDIPHRPRNYTLIRFFFSIDTFVNCKHHTSNMSFLSDLLNGPRPVKNTIINKLIHYKWNICVRTKVILSIFYTHAPKGGEVRGKDSKIEFVTKVSDTPNHQYR